MGMIGVKDVAGVVLVGIFFGYAAGACKCLEYFFRLNILKCAHTDIGINVALLAGLADDMSEVGQVRLLTIYRTLLTGIVRARMGLAFAFSGTCSSLSCA